MGPSGCGKSTLLNIVGMLDSPVGAVNIWFGNENIAGYSETQLSALRKTGDRLRLSELQPDRRTERGRECRAGAALSRRRPGLRAQEARRPGAGADEDFATAPATCRRSFPAASSSASPSRAPWSSRPKLILADEPTGNLDTANGEEVMQLLTQLNEEGTTIVMVTHSHSHAEYAHRIVNLLDGAIVTESIRQVL